MAINKIVTPWVNSALTEMVDLCQMTQDKLSYRHDKIAENQSGIEGKDMSLTNPTAVIRGLLDNAAIILSHADELTGIPAPKVQSK